MENKRSFFGRIVKNMGGTNVPILFLIFNRPETTKQVFSAICKAKPKKLYVAADGPRKNKSGEKELCERTRAIIKQIDWPCKVKTLFRKENLGCGKAVSSGITWFFENEEMGIILEDDCLPDKTFFHYCESLLNKYKDNEKIMMISGSNFISEKVKIKESYYFSRYSHIWGWASWRRAWKYYDYNMTSWPEFKKMNRLNSIFSTFEERFFWKSTLDLAYLHKISSWDAQFQYACFLNDGYCLYPCVNLISNIGFGKDSTHTSGENSYLSNIKRSSIHKIIHPSKFKQSVEIDYLNYQLAYNFSKPKLIYLYLLKLGKNMVEIFFKR